MTAEQLRDYLAEHIKVTFPDIPVYVGVEGRVYKIGIIFASDAHVFLERGDEEELSKF